MNVQGFVHFDVWLNTLSFHSVTGFLLVEEKEEEEGRRRRKKTYIPSIKYGTKDVKVKQNKVKLELARVCSFFQSLCPTISMFNIHLPSFLLFCHRPFCAWKINTVIFQRKMLFSYQKYDKMEDDSRKEKQGHKLVVNKVLCFMYLELKKKKSVLFRFTICFGQVDDGKWENLSCSFF